MGLEYVSELLPLTDIVFIPQMVYEYGEPRWNDIDRGNRTTRGKPVPVSLCLTQIPHGLTRAQTRDSAMRD
jgi:hypothetical protein